MSSLDKVLNTRTQQGHIPGVVAAAATKKGLFFESASGKRNLQTQTPMTTDTIFRIFSMTKPLCSVAAVKLYEQGALDYETPVEDILPAFSEIQVLEGFENHQPILRKPKTKATIRHLATHTTGFSYEIWNPLITQYLEVTKLPSILSGQKQAFSYPLVFDPGTKWEYGISTDWLGQVIEAVSGKTLARFCEEELFEPLNMVDTSFYCEGTKRERLATLYNRNPHDSFSPAKSEILPQKPEFHSAGHGLYSTAHDYMQFLLMLLNNGTYNGIQILKPETVQLLQQNHIGSFFIQNKHTSLEAISRALEFPVLKYSLGFGVNLEPLPGMRAQNSQGWGGLLNTSFWYDPTNGVAGIILMQILPSRDPQAIELFIDFETAVYANL